MSKGIERRGQEEFAYETVPLSQLRQGRRGKHHDLIRGILEQLEQLPQKSAMKIPIKQLSGLKLANVRAAVGRAASSRNIQIMTQSDDENLYISKR